MYRDARIWHDAKVMDFGFVQDHLVYLQSDWITEAKKENYRVDISGLWLKKDGQIYYFKTTADFYSLVAELVGEKVSEYFHLDTVHYELAKGTNENRKTFLGLASPYQANPKSFYQTWRQYLEKKEEYGYFSLTGLDILRYFEKDFSKEPLLWQTKALLLRELLTNEDDRLVDELLIEEREGHTYLGYLVDYAPECRLPFHYNIQIPLVYHLSLRDDKIVHEIKQDEVFQLWLEKALLFDIKRCLQEIKEEHQLHIGKEIEDQFVTYFATSQNILKMYLKR